MNLQYKPSGKVKAYGIPLITINTLVSSFIVLYLSSFIFIIILYQYKLPTIVNFLITIVISLIYCAISGYSIKIAHCRSSKTAILTCISSISVSYYIYFCITIITTASLLQNDQYVINKEDFLISLRYVYKFINIIYGDENGRVLLLRLGFNYLIFVAITSLYYSYLSKLPYSENAKAWLKLINIKKDKQEKNIKKRLISDLNLQKSNNKISDTELQSFDIDLYATKDYSEIMYRFYDKTNNKKKLFSSNFFVADDKTRKSIIKSLNN